MSNLKDLYDKEIKNKLKKELNIKSAMQVPKLEKIVINVGVGEAAHDSKFGDAVVKDIELITGQKPVLTKAKKSIAGFKIREGNVVGVKVTLRGEKMYVFLEKLIKVALPRVRDFRGLSTNSFDQFGNYSLGIKDQLVFPEIEYDNILKTKGMDIIIVTSTNKKEEAIELLSAFGMPFRR